MKIRSHIRSAVAMSWVLKTTVVPRRRISRTASFSTCALTGSRPENGSSRIRSDGFETTADDELDLLRHPLRERFDLPVEQAGQLHAPHPLVDRRIDSGSVCRL